MGRSSRTKWVRRAARFVRDGGPHTVAGVAQRDKFKRKEKFDRHVPIADRLIAKVSNLDALKRAQQPKPKRAAGKRS